MDISEPAMIFKFEILTLVFTANQDFCFVFFVFFWFWGGGGGCVGINENFS